MKNIFKNTKFKRVLGSTAITILVIGIVVLLNIIFNTFDFRKDFTQNKSFELSQKTLSVLADIDNSGKVVNVSLFTAPNYLDDKTEKMVEKLLEEYALKSKNFKYKIVEMDKNPSLVRDYNIDTPFTTVFESGKKIVKVNLRDLFEGMAFSAERAYTGAIINVLNQNPPVIYFVEGHKEMDYTKLAGKLKTDIENNGYVIKSLNIATQGKIPDDASALINIGPKTEFAKTEIDILNDYLSKGGRAMFLLPTVGKDITVSALSGLLKNYGVAPKEDIVFDLSNNFSNLMDFIIPEYGDNSIVNSLAAVPNYYMSLVSSRSLKVLGGTPNVTVETLLKSSPNSWSETNFQKYSKDPEDEKGPLPLAVYVTKTSDNEETRLIVVGNDSFVADSVLQYTQSVANVDFMLNSIDTLVGRENQLAISPKPLDIKPLMLPTNIAINWFYLLVIVIPALVFGVGVAVWIKRRTL